MFDFLINFLARGSLVAGDTTPGSAGSDGHFGLPNNEWSNIGGLSDGLPFDVKFGLLTPSDVSNAKGDLQAMEAQVQMQKEYYSTQQSLFDKWEEIRRIQVELAKLTMNGRYTIAQLDGKAAKQYHDHMAKMAILQQEITNSQALAETQKNYGIRLANHQLGLDRRLLGDQYGQERGYADAQYQQNRTRLADRFRARLDRLNSPRNQQRAEYEPTQGRVLDFNRRAS
jgi:hypothetical protein